MANYCVNLKHPDIKALSEQTGIHPLEIAAAISVWQEDNNTDEFPSKEYFRQKDENVNYVFKTVDNIFKNLIKVNNWLKQLKFTDIFWSKLQSDLQIPKEQIELLKNSKGNTIEEKLVDFVANYSYTIEINLAKESTFSQKPSGFRQESEDKIQSYTDSEGNTKWQVINTEIGVIESNFNTKEDALAFIGADVTGKKPTQYYSNLTVPGGTNYTEQEIATPSITPSIKGHAQFATDNGIGWFRSDESLSKDSLAEHLEEEEYLASTDPNHIKGSVKFDNAEGSKTRRILEVQSDLFQKGRGNEELEKVTNEQIDSFREIRDIDGFDEAKDYIVNRKGNKFLQLLNKDNNWVTFFVKSIIQSTAKQTVTEVQQEDVEAKVRELEKSGILKIKCD